MQGRNGLLPLIERVHFSLSIDQATMNLNDLPDELLICVLSLLPLFMKYGATIRLVCKRWNSLMNTPIYKRKAYVVFDIHQALAAESAPMRGSYFRDTIVPQLFSKYTCQFTEELSLTYLNQRVADTAEKYQIAPKIFSIYFPPWPSSKPNYWTIDSLNAVERLLSAENFTRRLRELTFLTNGGNTINLDIALNLPVCETIYITNCRPASNFLDKLLGLPAVIHVKVDDHFSNFILAHHYAKTISFFLRNYNKPDQICAKKLTISLNGNMFVFITNNGQFKKIINGNIIGQQ